MLRKIQITLKPKLRSAFSWVITQQVVVISHGLFGTTYWSHLPGSRIQKESLPNVWKWHRIASP